MQYKTEESSSNYINETGTVNLQRTLLKTIF